MGAVNMRQALRELDDQSVTVDEGQLRIDVALDAIEPGLSDYYRMIEIDHVEQRMRIAELKAENAALREFVAARDAVNCHDNGASPWVSQDRMKLLEIEAEIRVCLAEQYGVQLP